MIASVPSRESLVMHRKAIGLDDGPALLSALKAFGRGEASKMQQTLVLQFLVVDMGGVYTGADPKASDREAAMADGRAIVAKTLMLHCGLTLAVPGANQAHAIRAEEQ